MNAAAFPTGEVVAERYEIRGSARACPGYTGYRAFDRDIEVELALWCVVPSLLPSDDDRARLLAAARASRRLKNQDNVRRVFDAAIVDGMVYITAQLAMGERLSNVLATGQPADRDTLLRYADAMCDGLSSAHDQGVMHGRLVPDDVVQVSGRVKVGGIGLWLEAPGAAARAAWGEAARYVAPEAWDKAAVTPRSDVFSVAAILAELACGGSSAWRASSDVRDLKEDLSLTAPGLATELSAALAADPAARPDNPAALLASLRSALGVERDDAEAQAVDSGPVVELLDEELSGPAPIVEDDEPADDGPDDPSTAETVVGGPVRDDAKTNHFVRIDEIDGAPSRPIAPPVPEPVRRNASERLPLPLEADPSGEFDPVPDAEDAPEVVIIADAPDEELAADGSAAADDDGEDVPTDDIDVEHTPAEADASDDADEVVELTPAKRRATSAPPPPDEPHARLGSEPIGKVVGPARVGPPSVSQRMMSARPSSGLLPYAIIGTLAAAAVALLVWFGLSQWMSSDDDDGASAGDDKTAPATPPQPEPVVVAPGPAGPCPADMVLVEHAPEDGDDGAELRFCIDKYESPGEGRMPETGVTAAEARSRCEARKARLCTGAEWERACRGPTGASFPYGNAYRTVCNTPLDLAGTIAVTGAMEQCVSAEGVFDLSGNVAEWVASGRARGGSATDGRDGRCSRRRKSSPDRGHSDIGFRCCADAR